MSSEKNAHQGKKVEILFKTSLPNQAETVEIIKEALKIDQNAKIAFAYRTGTEGGKADVLVRFADKTTIGANIKSYTIGFNQATRMHPNIFIKTFDSPVQIGDILIDSILRKARDPRNENFILSQDSQVILKYFSEKAYKIIKHSICGKEKPELFVLYSTKEKKMNIYLMDKILKEMKNIIDVKLTKRGVIRLNPYFTVQKKGGNGIHQKKAKTDIDHGGNNIQVKINSEKIVSNIESLCYYKL